MRPDVTRGRRRLWQDALRLAAGALTACVVASAAFADDYRLQPGDTIEISVAGLPDMNLRAVVQIDGSIDIPMVGDVEAAGLTIKEARHRIRTILAGRMLPSYLPDGQEQLRMVDREQISASIVEYRPVFVSGDVVRPGEVAFRPGMTIRQAVASAGGVIPSSPVAPTLNAALLQAEYADAWHSAVSAAARTWRLGQELGEDAGFDAAAWPPAPAPGGSLDEILRVETELRTTRADNLARERAFLEETLTQIERQTAILRRQLEVEQENEKADAEALAQAVAASEMRAYLKEGLPDLRTAALFASIRRLDAESNLMQSERRRTEVARQLQRLEEERRVAVLSELRDARVVEMRERARLLAAEEQLRSAGISVGAEAPAGPPSVSVIRRGREIDDPVSYDSALLPGDVVEVARQVATPRSAAGTLAGEPVASAMR